MIGGFGMAAWSTLRPIGGLPAAAGNASAGPVVIVLGTAQDGGVPQANCFQGYCARVRGGEVPAPRVASLGIVDPESGKRFLIDATPDFVAQVGDLVTFSHDGRPPRLRQGSLRLEEEVQGILLTHAHMGHYTGLLHCGREAAATNQLPVYATTAMANLLSNNEPFARLIDDERLQLREFEIGAPLRLTDNLSVVPFSVVHRAELTDTVGLLISGPQRSLMYVPDADTWDGWPVPFAEWLDGSDIALLDGSFYSADELGHRWQGEVPHPPVAATVELLAPRVRSTSSFEVWFSHLNHTNPLWEEDSPERLRVERAGFGIARQGQTWEL